MHVQQILKEYLELHGYWVLFVGTFLWINLASALSWAVVFSLGGYLFGKSASLVLDNVSNYEQYLVLALLGFICLAWCIHAYHVWKLKKPARERLGRMRAAHASRKALS